MRNGPLRLETERDASEPDSIVPDSLDVLRMANLAANCGIAKATQRVLDALDLGSVDLAVGEAEAGDVSRCGGALIADEFDDLPDRKHRLRLSVSRIC